LPGKSPREGDVVRIHARDEVPARRSEDAGERPGNAAAAAGNADDARVAAGE
jgi:hypothetical protein